MSTMVKRWRGPGVYERWMLLCVALATLLRVILIFFNWPYTDSDEGNMGVLALHVAFQGDHPVFFYGGNYLGPLEGYLAAPLFRLFGSSLFMLRVPLVLFFLIFLIGMYYLVRMLYESRGYALAMVILLSLGSPDVLFLQLRASGEYPELEMFVVLMCLIATGLALTFAPGQPEDARARWKRIGLYALLGLVIGQALWVDMLAGPFVLAVVVLLVIFCRGELLRWPGLGLLIGLIVGGLPLIYYNLTAPWYENSLFVLFGQSGAGTGQFAAAHMSWLNKLAGMFFISLPMATGGAWSCAPVVFPPAGTYTSATVPCIIAQGGWSTGYLLLGVITTGAALLVLKRLAGPALRLLRKAASADEETRRQMVLQCGRLAVLAGAGLTLLAYTISANPALYPDTAFRYLTCLFLVLPILLWPLWRGLNQRRNTVRWWMRATLLLLVVAILATGTVRSLLQMPVTQARFEEQQTLVQDLQQAGATRLYSDYWTCNILIYLSDEKIICSAVEKDMRPAQDRYLPYRTIVRSTPHPGYIFTAGSSQELIMQQRAAANPSHYRIYHFFEYVVYQEI